MCLDQIAESKRDNQGKGGKVSMKNERSAEGCRERELCTREEEGYERERGEAKMKEVGSEKRWRDERGSDTR